MRITTAAVILLASIVMLSCDHDDPGPLLEDVVGEWVLIKSHDTENQVEKEGAELGRQELYTFFSNGTFTKSITENGRTRTATGKFHTEEAPLYISRAIRVMLKLKFAGGEPIYTSCQAEDREDLEISAHDGYLMNYIWGPCDGLILTYERK